MSVTIKVDDLPTRQFTAGSIAKALGAPLQEVREKLDALVRVGALKVKSATSGARNYSRTDQAKPKAEHNPQAAPKSNPVDLTNPGVSSTGIKHPVRVKSTKAKAEPKPRGTTVRFLHDGKPMPDSQNKLSSVAWYHTKGVLSEGSARMGVPALRQLLADEGVTDPANTAGWTVTLPNGVVISTEAI